MNTIKKTAIETLIIAVVTAIISVLILSLSSIELNLSNVVRLAEILMIVAALAYMLFITISAIFGKE